MRAMIAASISLFTGQEEMYWAQAIARELGRQKIDVDWFMLPVVHNPLLLPEQMVALRLLNVKDSSDLLLTVGYPAFVLEHHHKRSLLFSLAPSLHEHFDTEYGILSTPQYHRIRHMVKEAESRCLRESERIVCGSKFLTDQLQSELDVTSSYLVLEASPHDAENVLPKGNESWLVCESSLEPSDRIDLLLDAVSLSESDWRLLICMPSASVVYRTALEKRIDRLNLKGKVLLYNGALSKNTLMNSLALVTLPYSSARIPQSIIEAVQTLTPIITTKDSGAPREVVIHDHNGLIVEPIAREIARYIDQISTDPRLRNRLASGFEASGKTLSDVPSLVNFLMR